MTTWLSEGTAAENFELDSDCTLKGLGDTATEIKIKRIDFLKPHKNSLPHDKYEICLSNIENEISNYIKVNDITAGRDGLQSPIVKNIDDASLTEILKRTGAQTGDIIFFGADRAKVVNDAIGALRLKIGHEKGHASKDWQPLWVVDFPMFEYDDEAKRYVACHHPFTAPKDGHEDFLSSDPGKCIAKAYDMVLNGWEIGGGSVRIHREEVQSKVFRALNIGAEEAQEKFGFLLDALQYGAPPHGGIAFGLDRIVTMMTGAESIRDVIAFPKTQRAQCLLTQAPSPVDEKQLRELHIRLRNTQATIEVKKY